MEIQVEKLEELVWYLLAIINDIDRTKATMVAAYPNWDETDTTEFKNLTISRLNKAIERMQLL